MASQLSLYNDALLLCGERTLSSLTEAQEGRRLLDTVWNNGGVDTCLGEGFWDFAIRTQLIDYDTSEDPAFGYEYAFTMPSDLINVVAICTDEYFRNPISGYTRENNYWYADATELYVKYVSNESTQYGGQIGAWPARFKDFVAAYFAKQIVYAISKDSDRIQLVNDAYKERKHEAKSDAMLAQPPAFRPQGAWQRSRSSRYVNRDRGNRNGPLIG
jgi:hypothetical protein